MTQEEIEKCLREMYEKPVVELKGKTNELFLAVMTIADERDELKKIIEGSDEVNSNTLKKCLLFETKWRELLLFIRRKKLTESPIYMKMLEMENEIEEELYKKI